MKYSLAEIRWTSTGLALVAVIVEAEDKATDDFSARISLGLHVPDSTTVRELREMALSKARERVHG